MKGCDTTILHVYLVVHLQRFLYLLVTDVTRHRLRAVVGRNKPVHGRFRQEYLGKCGLLRRKRPLVRAYSGLHLSFNGSVRNIS